MKAHPELFPTTSPHFSLEAFHVQGSRILSRSFTIPLSRSDPSAPSKRRRGGSDDEDEEGDEEEEDEEEVAVMVPMADMLNAAYERDNARLFGDDDDDAGEEEGEVLDRLGEGYTMISTKAIKQGEQIVSHASQSHFPQDCVSYSSMLIRRSLTLTPHHPIQSY